MAIVSLAILAGLGVELARTFSPLPGAGPVPSLPPGPAASSFGSLRSVAFYENQPLERYLDDLRTAVPKIHAAGFNAVWLTLPWATMEPDPFASPPGYDDAAFADLRAALTTIAQHRMRALIGLNYLGRGWSPRGIDPCRWLRDPRMYGAFTSYAAEFLRRILPFRRFVDVLVFTETADPCTNAFHDADALAAEIRPTLGRLPLELPEGLRSRFTFGYHDNSLITRGWASEPPVATPSAFQFMSTVLYDVDADSRAQIDAELAERLGRFHALYPGMPVVLGETGATFCPPFDEANQARVLSDVVSYAQEHGLGFNIWHWNATRGESRCTNPGFRGLAITRGRGTPRPALVALRSLMERGA